MDRFSLPSLGHVASYLEEEKPPPPGRQAEVPSYDGLVAALAALPPIGTVVAPADRGGDLAGNKLCAAVMAALGALRSDDVEEMVGRTLALHSLLQALQSMLKDGGERAQEARAILEAACREAHAHGQVEEWMIIGVLSAEKKDC